jgi:hypothetical protein
VSEERLKAAVSAVGSYAKDVREYFERQGRGGAKLRDAGAHSNR